MLVGIAQWAGRSLPTGPVEVEAQLVLDGAGEVIFCNDDDILVLGGECCMLSTSTLKSGSY